MGKVFAGIFAGAMLLVGTTSASAVVVENTFTDLGGGFYEYNFTVINDPGVGPIGLVEFDFPFADFGDPGVHGTLFDQFSTPAGWVGSAFPGAAGAPPLDHTFSVAASLPADYIANGASLAGFSIVIESLLVNPTLSLPFRVYDNETDFNELASGMTIFVTEPETLLLLAFGAAALMVRRRRSL